MAKGEGEGEELLSTSPVSQTSRKRPRAESLSFRARLRYFRCGLREEQRGLG
jgi:hypothetical protein